MLSNCGSQRSELGSREYQAVSGQAPDRGQLASTACGSLPMGRYVPPQFQTLCANNISDRTFGCLPCLSWAGREYLPTHPLLFIFMPVFA